MSEDRDFPRLEAVARELPDLRVIVVSVDGQVSGRDKLVRDLGLRLEVVWDEGQRTVAALAPEEARS